MVVTMFLYATGWGKTNCEQTHNMQMTLLKKEASSSVEKLFQSLMGLSL